MSELKPCPFCGGEVRWCGDDPKDRHTCHLIYCEGCNVSFDMCPENTAKSLGQFKLISRDIFNKRAS